MEEKNEEVMEGAIKEEKQAGTAGHENAGKSDSERMHVVRDEDDEYDAEDPNITTALAWMGIHLELRNAVQAGKGLMIKGEGDDLAFTDGRTTLKVPRMEGGRGIYADQFYDLLKDYMRLYDPAILAMIEAKNDEEYIQLAYAYDSFKKKMEKFTGRFYDAIWSFKMESVI